MIPGQDVGTQQKPAQGGKDNATVPQSRDVALCWELGCKQSSAGLSRVAQAASPQGQESTFAATVCTVFS